MKKLVLIGCLLIAPLLESGAAFAEEPAPSVVPKRKVLVPHQPTPPDASYVLKVEAPAAKKGQPAVAHVKITPGAGFHMNKEYPTSLALTPPAGVTLGKTKLTAKDAAKWEAEGGDFAVSYTAAQSGKQVVTGELKFAVCSESSCDPKKSNISFEIDVK
jgi:hypothetical protein